MSDPRDMIQEAYNGWAAIWLLIRLRALAGVVGESIGAPV